MDGHNHTYRLTEFTPNGIITELYVGTVIPKTRVSINLPLGVQTQHNYDRVYLYSKTLRNNVDSKL